MIEENVEEHQQDDLPDEGDYVDNEFLPSNQFVNNQMSTMSKLSNGTVNIHSRDPHIRAAL